MMQPFLFLAAVSVFALGVFGTSPTKPQPAPIARAQTAQPAPNSWTILVYLHGDNNLEESSVADLEEMEAVGSGPNFNVVVQWDRLSDEGITRIKVGKGEQNSEVVEELPELNSDDPKTLADFVRWGVKTYPASRYGLVIWDHGAQWNGIGGDETSDTGDIMDLNEIQQALQNSLKSVGLNQFDFLAFDTCLMGGLEPLVQLGAFGKIMIANPEIDYGDGWDYATDLGFLKDKPGATLQEFAKQQNANWAAHHNSDLWDVKNHAHVVYDSKKIGAVASASKSFLSALLEVWDKDAQTLASVRGQTLEYDFDKENPHAPHDYVDFGDFAAKLALKNPSLKSSSDALNAAIESSILAKTLGKNNAKARGLSAWLPSDRKNAPDQEKIDAYFALPSHTRTNWAAFVGRWFDAVKANTDGPEVLVAGAKNVFNPNAQAAAKVGFKVRDQDLKAVYAAVGQQDGDNFTYLGDLFFKSATPGSFGATWDGTRPFVSDGRNSVIFPGYIQDPNDILLYAPAIATPPKTKKAFEVTLLYDPVAKRIVSALDDSGASPKRITLEVGTLLEVQYLQYNAKADENQFLPTGVTLVVPAGGVAAFKVTQARLPAGKYSLTVGAVDWAGNDNFEETAVTLR